MRARSSFAVLSVAGAVFYAERTGRVWDAYSDCDCALGPHRHLVASAPTLTLLRVRLAAPVEVGA